MCDCAGTPGSSAAPPAPPSPLSPCPAAYLGSHFASFFKTIEQLTTVGAQDYISARLRKVTRQTLKHELSALRRLAKWAHARGYLVQMPEIETPGRRVLGTPVAEARKKVSLIFTAEEIAAIIAHLPEYWSAPRAQTPYPVRARFIVAWETALRPRTLAKLEAPTDYRLGAATLRIRDEIDKNRFGRELPLSAAARAALDSVCPPSGSGSASRLIFGDHDCIMLLRRAAKEAGIDAHRADRTSDYDFRRSAAAHLGRSFDNLPGVMYLLGHKQPATTARYMRPQKDAALEVLLAATPPKLSTDSGPIVATERKEPVSFRSPAPDEFSNDFVSVRGGGLEPPWLLTASTSRDGQGPEIKGFGALERQETTEDVTERPFPGTCARNDEGAPDERIDVEVALTDALESWMGGADLRQLRRCLFRILDLIEHIDASLLAPNSASATSRPSADGAAATREAAGRLRPAPQKATVPGR